MRKWMDWFESRGTNKHKLSGKGKNGKSHEKRITMSAFVPITII
jgi:hypothetical protein